MGTCADAVGVSGAAGLFHVPGDIFSTELKPCASGVKSKGTGSMPVTAHSECVLVAMDTNVQHAIDCKLHKVLIFRT